jgi:hypothetical protein
MDDLFCPTCRLRQPLDHSYCVSCGTPLPTHLLASREAKAARFFAGIKVGRDDPESGFLKVSCYLRDQIIDSPEGVVRVPGNHVRISLWVDDRATCVMSLPAAEAQEMATFILRELSRIESAGTTWESSGTPTAN